MGGGTHMIGLNVPQSNLRKSNTAGTGNIDLEIEEPINLGLRCDPELYCL